MKENNILVLSGFGRTESSYHKLIETAPDDTAVFVVSYTDLPLNTDSTVKDMKAILEKLGLSSAHFVGDSLGGIVAMQIAAQAPGLVQSLTLVDSAGTPMSRGKLIQTTLLQSVTQHPLENALDNIRVVGRIIKHPIISWKALSYTARADMQSIAKTIHVPTLILWGEKDKSTPLSVGNRFHALIPNSQMVILPKYEHDWILRDPQTFWNRVRKRREIYTKE